MKLKFYLVLQGPDDEIVLWKRPEYENYIKGAAGVGAGSAYRVITHFDPGESLIGNRLTFPDTPTHDLTDIEREAAELYPKPASTGDYVMDLREEAKVKGQRAAHISCAKQFLDKVKGLEVERDKWKKLAHDYVGRIQELEQYAELYRKGISKLEDKPLTPNK
jgi:hypothetical protein